MAGWRQQFPARVRAPQRAVARKSPGAAPFLSRPRRSNGRLVVAEQGRAVIDISFDFRQSRFARSVNVPGYLTSMMVVNMFQCTDLS
jgi:hypothetical protein